MRLATPSALAFPSPEQPGEELVLTLRVLRRDTFSCPDSEGRRESSQILSTLD